MLGSVKLKYNPAFLPKLVSVYPNISRHTAMYTFAVSVRFCLGDDIYTLPGGTENFVMEGTGIAIDDHHILSSAHLFEWPVG